MLSIASLHQMSYRPEHKILTLNAQSLTDDTTWMIHFKTFSIKFIFSNLIRIIIYYRESIHIILDNFFITSDLYQIKKLTLITNKYI
ncbi:hypothetical protein HK25_01335 [Acetobacter sp. DsW_059]|nr:hypothetical protein HK25_01335 [Acetobacter sp. DsW_059]